ncbi:MAG: Eco57I restriction-modification methylase domain-containing protein [Blastocatellales bacterium]|nr:Eco57I restriction-modification methylase domain-containing protein [Blastocatellales bacterium]
MILDLAGYTSGRDLAAFRAVEPAAGEGAFLTAMIRRLVESCRQNGQSLADCREAIFAYELDDHSAAAARGSILAELTNLGIPPALATRLAEAWVRTADYLIDAPALPPVDFVIGNPPYIRLEDIPPQTAAIYRSMYSTMVGRADLYVAFFEAALGQLAPNGVCAFICADRWMLNQYGIELRRLVTSGYSVEAVVEMHNAAPFLTEVSAYPAVTILRRARQGPAVVASLDRPAEGPNGRMASALRSTREGKKTSLPTGLKATRLQGWFSGAEPWPCSSPERLSLLQDLESRFEPLESEKSGTRVGIGVATGADKIFITKNGDVAEASRILPLAMASDIADGELRWSGHYLVNPWEEEGLIKLQDYPRLRLYLEQNAEVLGKRHVARKNPVAWYRTIDRVNLPLCKQLKLYIADIKDRLNPVLDRGETYPHHNLYFIQSDVWDLEVLGGLLLSDIGQFFVESYGVRMRGGYLRFQAQYLRKIRTPQPADISRAQAKELTRAFRKRDRNAASEIALDIYGVKGLSEGA